MTNSHAPDQGKDTPTMTPGGAAYGHVLAGERFLNRAEEITPGPDAQFFLNAAQTHFLAAQAIAAAESLAR